MMPGREIERGGATATRKELLEMLAVISEHSDGEMLISGAMSEVLPFFKESPLWVEIRAAGEDR